MPSLEILCDTIGKEPLTLPKVSFEIETSRPPLSHRNPSLFQYFFDREENKKSTLCHFGMSRGENWFDAYELVDLNDDLTLYGIKPKFHMEFATALEQLKKRSKRLCCFFDYQFSPGQGDFINGVNLSEFLRLAAKCQLCTNSGYLLED